MHRVLFNQGRQQCPHSQHTALRQDFKAGGAIHRRTHLGVGQIQLGFIYTCFCFIQRCTGKVQLSQCPITFAGTQSAALVQLFGTLPVTLSLGNLSARIGTCGTGLIDQHLQRLRENPEQDVVLADIIALSVHALLQDTGNPRAHFNLTCTSYPSRVLL